MSQPKLKGSIDPFENRSLSPNLKVFLKLCVSIVKLVKYMNCDCLMSGFFNVFLPLLCLPHLVQWLVVAAIWLSISVKWNKLHFLNELNTLHSLKNSHKCLFVYTSLIIMIHTDRTIVTYMDSDNDIFSPSVCLFLRKKHKIRGSLLSNIWTKYL